MKETRDTLKGFLLIPGRMSGNSTRQMDLAIQYLFEGYKVEVKDHWEDGKSKHTNSVLLNRIVNRLHMEHRLNTEHILVDKFNSTIELI